MKKGIRIERIIYGIVAALLFGALWLFTFPLRKVEQSYAPQIVIFGDSICGQVRDETAVSACLSEILGQEVYNGALGGTCCSRIETEGRMAYTRDSLSFAALSRAAALKDFGTQQTANIRENFTEYFPEVVDTLEQIDFSGVDILLVLYGVNDYHAGVPVDDPEDARNEHTYGGALRSALSFWQEAYPDMRIILLTSTYAWYTGEVAETCEEKDYGGGILEDYVDKEMQVAEEMDVELLDLYHDLYPHASWEDWQLYTADGLHPNEAGRRLIAETIAAYLGQ
ncbi:MAG: SGNH/GDSL hydrolase family protein [Eubacterium sp.]|nr:SGNH/GDSL hydrolase family protein [Eubacterium sp.]MCM1215863.1 SGNH/GDSL hydrolase family protein [Lachnospiraceae bacterium]MCM1304048.1 SGNH/GDSL hydrolase family protein [Butyrivibrio sp.]MCM1345326.1 SGNH/GDSL hydrolase family protein [Muribaculaceae bacterium]MCM1239243.1 SGNH/GDSL hydrolase family protein [Lachnospiraceae bacterium]